MSALAGIWNFEGKPDARRACARMLAAQALYGPNVRDDLDLGSIAMGRNLFSTLPEDRFDAQPLTGGEGRFVLVADIRLDNRDTLATVLGLSPDHSREMADSAFLLAAWERWNDACFDHLVGDYAFALLDRGAQRLILARDPMATRPLHYHLGRNFIAFASMPKGLHALPEVPRAPDESFVANFLALMPETSTHSFFKDIARVEPGSVVIVTPSGIAARRHWNPSRQVLRLADADAYAEGMLHHLDRATRDRLRGAGNNVGSHLSSGFDSSAVASSAAIEMARVGGKVIAFTSVPRQGYDRPMPRGRYADEGPLAMQTAAMHPNIEPVLVRSEGVSPLASLERNFRLFDRPMLNLCNQVWLDAICDAAKARQLTVLLSGQMGNMTISHDGLTLLPTLARQGRWLELARQGRGLVRHQNYRWHGVLAAALGPYMPAPLWRVLKKAASGTDYDVRHYAALNSDLLRDGALEQRARASATDLNYRPRKDGFETRLWILSRVDPGPYHKGVLGGWGLDCRDPTADRRLFEFCLSIPEEQFMANGRTKSLARRALAGRVTPGVLEARGKGLQAADWHEALTAARGELRSEVARLENCDPASRVLELSRLKQLAEEWPQDGWERDDVMMPYRLALLRSLSAGDFLRRASGSNV